MIFLDSILVVLEFFLLLILFLLWLALNSILVILECNQAAIVVLPVPFKFYISCIKNPQDIINKRPLYVFKFYNSCIRLVQGGLFINRKENFKFYTRYIKILQILNISTSFCHF